MTGDVRRHSVSSKPKRIALNGNHPRWDHCGKMRKGRSVISKGMGRVNDIEPVRQAHETATDIEERIRKELDGSAHVGIHMEPASQDKK